MSKEIYRSLLIAAIVGAPLLLQSWEEPRTRERTAFVIEVGPGVLFKGPKSKLSALYQVDSQGNLTDPFGNTRSVDWQTGVGIRASAEVISHNKEGAEFLYTGLYNWTPYQAASNSTTGVGVLTSPYTTTDWEGAEKITWSTATSYNSYELIMWFYVTPRFENFFSFAVNFGGRFINIVDTDLFYSFYTQTSTPSELSAQTNNWLRGGEVGFEINVRPLSYFNWGVILKGAGFADSINRSIYLTDLDNTTVVADTNSYSETAASGLGEALPYIGIQNRYFTMKLLGDFVYIGNISTTAKSFNKIRKVTDIKFTNKFLLQGVFVDIGCVF